MHKRFFLTLAFSILLMTGCASVYKGEGIEKLVAEDIAVLETGAGTLEGNKTTITHIDGKHRGVGVFKRYELAPGEHFVEVILQVGRSVPEILYFKADRGRSYVLMHVIDKEKKTWSVTIIDKSSTKVVSYKK